jgi:hypothetical protein
MIVHPINIGLNDNEIMRQIHHVIEKKIFRDLTIDECCLR